jgi:hypothetical protein
VSSSSDNPSSPVELEGLTENNRQGSMLTSPTLS